MAPRHPSQLPSVSFHPPNDPATYRDLLLFEERLKTNAATLQRRKSRYQLFLVNLVLAIVFLLSEVLLQTAFLEIPYTYVLRAVLPDVYADIKSVPLHRYVPLGLLFVAVTALLLFFASGMYSEKIAYANRYVPHANKALRSFNMYLNVRRPPLRSKFSFNPLSWFYSRPPATLKPDSTFPATPASSDRSTTIPISPIPPSSNPRGELIFSSRVDRSFRESYERYRGAFERKRQERERSAAMRTWLGWLTLHMPWNKQRTAVQPVAGATQDRAASASGRKTGHRVPTPSPAAQSGPSSSPLRCAL